MLVNSSSARVQWGQVECLDANGLVESYLVSYGVLGSERNRVNTTDRMLVITDLVPGQEYSVQVAALNSAGQGPFSERIVVRLTVGMYAHTHTHITYCDRMQTRAGMTLITGIKTCAIWP
jgi:hypothetical protein